jgi:hypothetical protein
MKRLYLIVPGAIVALLIGIVVFLRVGTPPATSGREDTPQNPAQTSFSTARDLIHKAVDYDDCRYAVQQVNLYLDGAQEKPRPPSKEELDLLKNREWFGLDDSELAEVNRESFTPLDAHHLDLCLLLQDAVRSLRLDRLAPREQARACFDWVMRQVQLRERTGDALPPDFVLRRGWGTALERAQIFLAVLQQLGIDGCMLAVPGKPGEPAIRYWLPGALSGKDIYLFDTRLGLPLPGPRGEGIATLAQVRSQPAVLQQLALDPKNPYDVSQDQAAKAEVHVACALSALAPRMRFLQDQLAATEKVRLGVDPVALVKRFAEAAQAPEMKGLHVRVWNLPGDPSSPIRVLRSFLPENEGGVDKARSRERYLAQLVPREYFPAKFKEFDQDVVAGLLEAFLTPFIPFHTQAKMSEMFLLRWMPDLAAPVGGKTGSQKAPLLQMNRFPRDLMLRGRFDEATTTLVLMSTELERRIQIVQLPNASQELDRWCQQAREVFNALQQAQQRRDPDALQQAKERRQQLLQNGKIAMAFLEAGSAVPMLDDVTYLLALCKHEQAERLQAQEDQARAEKKAGPKNLADAWLEASDWWGRYLQNYSSPSAAASARLRLARARLALGQRDEAVNLLREKPESLTSFEKLARQYLARQWKAQ